MRKRLFWMILLFCFIILGCGSNYTLDDLKKDIYALDKDAKVSPMFASMIGADVGYKYTLKDCTIEVYKFDKSSKEYKEIYKTKKITFSSDTKSLSFDVTVKNGYIYYIDKGSCEKVIKYIKKLS